MRVNNECIATVLNYIIENVTISCDPNNAGYKSIDMLSIVNNISESGTYTKEEILHSCMYAIRYNLIALDSLFKMADFIPTKIDIFDITPYGYKFLKNKEFV